MKKFFNAAINNSVSITVISLFLTFLIWWIWSYFFVPRSLVDVSLWVWADLYQVIALYGAIFGLIASKRWGGTGSFMGRAIIGFSIGLFFQCIGQSIFAYYIDFLNIMIPYPSLADVGFFGSILFYIYGALMLARVSGEKLSLKFIGGKIQLILIPLAVLALSYFIFLQGYSFDWSNPIKIFLDFGTTFVEAVAVSISLLAFSLTRQKLGGALDIPITFFTLALVSIYLSDFVFLYQANDGVYFAGGINDLMYAISYVLMVFSLILLSLWPSLVRD